MTEDIESKAVSNEEDAKIKAQTMAQLMRGRLNDYVAIVLAVGTVFILWLLQWAGLY
jgi:hypothetical protein